MVRTSDIYPNDVIVRKPSGQIYIVCGIHEGKCGLKLIGGSSLLVAEISDCELVEYGNRT